MAYRERDYAGSSFDFSTPKGVKQLITISVAAYFVYYLARMFSDFAPFSWIDWLFERLLLNPRSILESFTIWQPLTYLFVHQVPQPWHILFNMMGLWFLGRELERAWGTRRFIQFYLTCGVGVGLIVVLADLLFLHTNGLSFLGASGAACSILLAFGMMFPDRELFFFPLPFSLKAKYLVGILMVIYMLPGRGFPATTYVCHAAGFLMAFLFMKVAYQVGSADPLASLSRQYREWKLARAKRKFQVYMNKQRRD